MPFAAANRNFLDNLAERIIGARTQALDNTLKLRKILLEEAELRVEAARVARSSQPREGKETDAQKELAEAERRMREEKERAATVAAEEKSPFATDGLGGFSAPDGNVYKSIATYEAATGRPYVPAAQGPVEVEEGDPDPRDSAELHAAQAAKDQASYQPQSGGQMDKPATTGYGTPDPREAGIKYQTPTPAEGAPK